MDVARASISQLGRNYQSNVPLTDPLLPYSLISFSSPLLFLISLLFISLLFYAKRRATASVVDNSSVSGSDGSCSFSGSFFGSRT